MTRFFVAIPALVGLQLATTEVRAQAAPTPSEAAVADSVELKNGGYLRGLIVEVDPASHVSLRTPDGQIRRIPVAEIEAADRAGKPLALTPPPTGTTPTAAAPAAAAAAPTGPAPNTARPAAPVAPPVKRQSELEHILAGIPGPRVKLAVQANRSAFLQRRIGEPDENAVAYHLVCKLPCEVELPAEDRVPYRVSNLRLSPTEWFTVPKYNARVRVDLASDMWPVWTRSMLVSGVLFGVTGGAFVGINELSGEKQWARTTGYALLGVGGACLIASGLFALFSPRTSYSLERVP